MFDGEMLALVKDDDLADHFKEQIYIRCMVSNNALEAISGLTLTCRNYNEAIEILPKMV